MIVVPVSVRAYKVKVSVVNDTVSVVIVPSAITATLVSNMISAALTKENITGLKETDSPEFSSLQSKALQSATNGGQIPDTDYSWFKGLFAGLQDKFIFSWIYGLIILVKSLASRVGVLENSVIADYTLSTNQSVAIFPEINISNLGISHGQDFSIHVYFPALPDNVTQAAVLFRFNTVDTDGTKYYAVTNNAAAFSLITGLEEGSFIMDFKWGTNKVDGNLTTYRITGTTRTVQITAIGTNGNWLTDVSSFIIRTTQIITWPAGTRIIIKKR